MSFDKKKIDAKIAALRKDRKLTQEHFAEKVGFTVQYLGTIERGKANTTLNMLYKIADILSCSSNDLIFSTTHLDTIVANMSGSVLPVHGQPYLQRIPTENNQLSAINLLIQCIIP